MIYNLAHNGNKLITFTIDGTTYQAIDGMTWGEWVDSEYNVNQEYFLEANIIFIHNMSGRVERVAEATATDTIKDNSAYVLILMGGGSTN